MRIGSPSVNPYLRPRHKQASFWYSAHLASAKLAPTNNLLECPVSCVFAVGIPGAQEASKGLQPSPGLAVSTLPLSQPDPANLIRPSYSYKRNKLPPRRPRTLKQQSGQPDVQMASCTQTVISPPRRPRTLKPQSGQPHVQMASCTQTVVFHQFSCPSVCSEPNPTKTTLPPKQNNAPKWTP